LQKKPITATSFSGSSWFNIRFWDHEARATLTRHANKQIVLIPLLRFIVLFKKNGYISVAKLLTFTEITKNVIKGTVLLMTFATDYSD
jgi:hypothetical protein